MRKIYFLLFTAFTFFASNSKLTAQTINSYVFTSSTTTYTAISGTASTATGDDGIQGGIPIGFTFNFGGTNYTHIALTTNGYIKLGGSAVAITASFGGFNNTVFTTSADRPLIAPLWDDMNITGGNIQYSLSGSAGSQIFTVQWTSNHWSDGGSSGAPVNSYQVKLFEGTNVIQFIYGTMNGSATGAASIGISDASGFLSVMPGTTATASSTTANNSISSATNLTSGTTYTFSPPPPCVPGSIAGGTTQSSVVAACSGVNFNLSVTGASFGTGLTYQWESSSNGTSWSPIGGATNAALTTSQTTATYYRRKMTCSGTDAWSGSLQVTQNPVSACYCTVLFPSSIEPITLVNFANINNTTSATVGGSPALENFTAIVGNVSKGQTYTITIKGNTDGNFTTYINVYMDWNQDGDFTDGGENFYLGTITNSTGTDAIQVTGSILIPATSLNGNTRMRVIKAYGAQATSCNTTGYGQAEDYTLNITTPPCATPTSISISTLTTTSVSVSFTASGTSYVEYGLPGFTPGTGTTGGGGTVVSGASPVTLTGLTPNTLYDVYVRQDCGGGIFSVNGSGGSFTICAPVNSFPFTETFEATSGTRSCWMPQIITGTYNWTYGAGAGNGGVTTAHGGSVNARYFGTGYGGETTRLISPELNLSGMAYGADLEFWMINPSWLGDINELRIYYKTSAAGAWTLIPGAVYANPVGIWTKVEIDNLPNISSAYYIAFEGTQLYGYGVGVDDVTIKAAPSCRQVKNLSVIGTTPATANVYFTSPGSAFIVEYGVPGFTPGTNNAAGAGGTLVLGASSPITITGLAASTTYDFYVRQICTPGVDYSVNVKYTATTLCPATSIPYIQNFESAVVPGMPTCTSVQDVNGNSGTLWFDNAGGSWETYTDIDPLAYVSPSKSLLYFYDPNNTTRPADDWFYTQGLNLTAGTSYRLKFFYRALDGVNYPEKLEVKYGTVASAATMTAGTIFTNNNISSIYNNPFDSARVDFTPSATGVYYIGFHAFSAADMWGIFVDDISVRVTPVVDAGATGITAIPTCPAANGVIQATIRNYNLTTLNFATYPVTVTANISGASTGSINTVVNAGTLAPGASMTVSLPAFNYITGTYNITVATSSPNDPETANNAYTTTFFVNPGPTLPVITPAAPAICVGAVQQLSATSSGAITWSPITNLYTTSAANTIYTGETATTVYAKPAVTTTYTATATSNQGCKSTLPVTITVNTNPVVTITSLPSRICNSDTLVSLSASPAGGTWTGIGISGNTFLPSRTGAGTYTLSYTSTNAAGCTTIATTAAKVEDCPERVRLLRDDAVVLFPNPAIARFNIRVNSVLYNKLTMYIYNSNGGLIRTQQYSGLVYGRVISVDISYIPAGTYMVQFSYDGGVRSSDKTFKVVVAH